MCHIDECAHMPKKLSLGRTLDTTITSSHTHTHYVRPVRHSVCLCVLSEPRTHAISAVTRGAWVCARVGFSCLERVQIYARVDGRKHKRPNACVFLHGLAWPRSIFSLLRDSPQHAHTYLGHAVRCFRRVPRFALCSGSGTRTRARALALIVVNVDPSCKQNIRVPAQSVQCEIIVRAYLHNLTALV